MDKEIIMIKSIQNFFKGMIIGVANIIPGVSGGTLWYAQIEFAI